jgi:hypothetical protein
MVTQSTRSKKSRRITPIATSVALFICTIIQLVIYKNHDANEIKKFQNKGFSEEPFWVLIGTIIKNIFHLVVIM